MSGGKTTSMVECSRCSYQYDGAAMTVCPVCGAAPGTGMALPRTKLKLEGRGKMPALFGGILLGLLGLCMCSLISLSAGNGSRTPTARVTQLPPATATVEAEPIELGTSFPMREPTATNTPTALPPTRSPSPTVAVEPTATTEPTSTPPPTLTPAPTPTALPIPTPTPPPTLTPAPTSTPLPVTINSANLRAGPGTEYPIIGALTAGQSVHVIARNPAGDWYQLAGGAWIFGALLNYAPDVPVAPFIPTPPPPTATATRIPPTATPVVVTQPPAAPVRYCCKICTTGKACGDTCIARNKTCHVGPGCACDG